MVRLPGIWEKEPVIGKGGIEFIRTKGTTVVVLSTLPEKSKAVSFNEIRRLTKRGELKGVTAVEQMKRLLKSSLAVEALRGNKSGGREVENARPIQLSMTAAGLKATLIPEIVGTPNDSRLK